MAVVFTFIDTCFGTQHLNLAEDNDNTLWSSNTQDKNAVAGWVMPRNFGRREMEKPGSGERKNRNL